MQSVPLQGDDFGSPNSWLQLIRPLAVCSSTRFKAITRTLPDSFKFFCDDEFSKAFNYNPWLLLDSCGNLIDLIDIVASAALNVTSGGGIATGPTFEVNPSWNGEVFEGISSGPTAASLSCEVQHGKRLTQQRFLKTWCNLRATYHTCLPPIWIQHLEEWPSLRSNKIRNGASAETKNSRSACHDSRYVCIRALEGMYSVLSVY